MESFKEPSYDELSFEQLAKDDPEFHIIYTANNNWLDFQNPQMVKQLTKSLLKRDFGLNVELPDNRLCPPVPIRYQYIKYVQRLLDSTTPSLSEHPDPNRLIEGIDIGVGSSCIYPLLACASHPSWRFRGTDIDPTNLYYARKNVEANSLQSRITVLDVVVEEKLLPWERLVPPGTEGTDVVRFVMCNPPFYESKEAMSKTISKDSMPSAVCTGAEVEMICDGGDVGFAMRILEESVLLGQKVQWYSCMLGRLESVQVLVTKLKDKGCQNWVVATLVPGKKTRRWVVGWSWGDLRPDNSVARGDVPWKELLPFPTEYSFDSECEMTAIGAAIHTTMTELELRWDWSSNTMIGTAFSKQNIWSRAARRKKRREDNMEIDSEQANEIQGDGDTISYALVARVKVLAHLHRRRVEIRWLQGTDTVLFESFCAMLKRKVLENTGGKGQKESAKS